MAQPLYVAFIWHMHQPYYRDLVTGTCSMPWVRLHATKDYLDMVKILEPFPSLHQTVNVVPSLLDQLEEYSPPTARSDAFLELSRKPAAHLTPQEQRFLLQWFFLAHPERMIKPYPRYHDLFAKRGLHVTESDWPLLLKRFRTQDYLDLQVWFNLAWIDPWLRRQDPRLLRLEEKGGCFTEEEKSYVLDCHLTLMARIIPTYRDAAQRGQLEVTSSPYYHPIMPLLCDTRAAQMALPHVALPQANFRHPEDARWHLHEGLARHAMAFGTRPHGVWPPEGSVSEEFVRLAMEEGVRWIATDEEILWRTLKSPRSASALYRPHLLRRRQGQLAIVFRDRELSDLIGFVYSQWDPEIAVADFLKRLVEIHQQFQTAAQPPLVSIILDGENAWESYPEDGHTFLSLLYEALASDERFRCVTVSEFLRQSPLEHAESLPELFSGSWIDGNFATWIGHPEKNAAWVHLVHAREALAPFDRSLPAYQQAWKSLGIAEGSDWMWWFGDTHFSAHADEFDRLFRAHLSNCYRLAGLEVPGALGQPIRHQTHPLLHAPTAPVHPVIDGRDTSYYEWLYAGRLDLKHYSAIHRAGQCLQQMYYGFDETHAYFRFDVDHSRLDPPQPWRLELVLSHNHRARITLTPASLEVHVFTPEPLPIPCAFDRILECAIPFKVLGVGHGETLALAIRLFIGQDLVERYPEQGTYNLLTSLGEVEAYTWSV